MKSKTPQELGRQAEKDAARRQGGEVVRGSGSWVGAKGDRKIHTVVMDFLVENKFTLRKSFGVKLEALQKIAREARQSGRAPAFNLVFGDGAGRPLRDGSWVMLREADWIEILDFLEEHL
jgi:hypothetical protein